MYVPLRLCVYLSVSSRDHFPDRSVYVGLTPLYKDDDDNDEDDNNNKYHDQIVV